VSAVDETLALPVDPGATVPVRRLVVMAAIAAALAFVALVTVLPRLEPPTPTQGSERLVDLDPKRVRGVEIILRDRPIVYSFTRRDETWTLSALERSVEVPADRLDGFLETLAGLTRLVVIEGPEVDLKEFGLAPPRAIVTLRDGRGFSFAIGDRNPPLTALYVQVLPSSKIDLVGAVLLWDFDKLVALTKTLPVEQPEQTDSAEMR